MVPDTRASSLVDCPADRFRAAMAEDPLGFLTSLRGHGELVQLHLGDGRRLFVAFHPGAIGPVLAVGHRTHRELLRRLVGAGLFVAESGPRWRRRRQLVAPLLAGPAAAWSDDLVARTVERFLAARWAGVPATAEIDLSATMQELSIAVMLRLVDPGLDERRLDDLGQSLRTLIDQLDLRLFEPGQPVDDGVFQRCLDELVEHVTARSGHGAGAVSGLLGGLLGSPIEGDREEAVREEVMSLFVAGVETMGALLTWAFWHQMRHPEAYERSRDEVRAGGDDLPYTSAVVLESLRLSPPAWALRRVIDRPLDAAGWRFEAGDTVLLCPFVTHRDHALWVAAESFRPERFLERPPSPHQLFPFGGGPHRCPGRDLTLSEARAAVAAVHRTGRLEFVSGGERARPGIALAPAPNVRVRLHREVPGR